MLHVWHCIAFIPSPEFKVHHSFKSLPSVHIFHWSLDVNPDRFHCNCYTWLVSITDLPEQQLIAGVLKNVSPVSLAEIAQFGDPTPAVPQTCKHTLQLILDICKDINPWDLTAFQKASKALKLLGVHLLFWCNWMFSEPYLFLTGKVLHTLHKFFFRSHPHLVQSSRRLTYPQCLLQQSVSTCFFLSLFIWCVSTIANDWA